MTTVAKTFIPVILALVALWGGREVGRQMVAPISMEVVSKPKGASVFVDGKFRGYSPMRVNGLARGKHVLRLEAAGYVSTPTVVNLEKPERFTIEPAKKPMAGLTVDSIPVGASVILDGHVIGRTPLSLDNLRPGRCSLEVSKTNYLPFQKLVSLQSDGTEKVQATLIHRQAQVYRERIKNDEGDISAYNDLGELLFVLGRYTEAADVYIDGFLILDKYRGRSSDNSRNAGKMQSEARRKHVDKERKFHAALDKALMDAVAEDKVSRSLFKEFKKVRYQSFRAEYINIFENLAKRQKDNYYLTELMDFWKRSGNYNKVLDWGQVFLERKPSSHDNEMSAAHTLVGCYFQTPEKKRPVMLSLLERLFVHCRKMKRSGKKEAEMLYAESKYAVVRGEEDKHFSYLKKAIEKMPTKWDSVAKISNKWKLELAAIHESKKEWAAAADILQSVVEKNIRRDPSLHKARRMLGRLEREAVKNNIPAIRCWQLLGPFPNADGKGLDAALLPEKEGVNIHKTYPALVAKLKWKKRFFPDNYIDLKKKINPPLMVLAYAASWVYSPKDRKVDFLFGSDDAGKIFLNRKLVHTAPGPRGAVARQDKVGVTLKKGWNEVMVKVANLKGAWGFYFEIMDPEGNPPKGLKLSLTPKK